MIDITKKSYIQDKHNLLNEELFDKIRKRLKLTKKQLPSDKIKKVLKLNNKLIGEWIVNNADGFKIKDNGIMIVSKWMPKCLRGDKQEKIEEILANPKNDEYMKKMFIARYNKLQRNFTKGGKTTFSNLHSFFYVYRVMWFNSRNCKFDKADLYEFLADKELRAKLANKIVEGKDYFDWQISDFRQTKKADRANKKLLEARKKEKRDRRPKIQKDLEKLKEE